MLVELGLVGTLIVLSITLIAALAWLGLFDRVRVETGSPPIQLSGRVLAYKAHRDTYSGIGFQFTKQYNWSAVQSASVRSLLCKTHSVGFYYDSPTDKKQRGRFLVGLLLNEQSDCDEVRECLKSEGYRFATLPDIDHVVHTSFPYRSFAAASVANKKVYPVIAEYLKENRLCAYPTIDIYTNDHIYFILPLSKQQDFFYYYKPESDDEDEKDEIEREDELMNDDDFEHVMNYDEEDEEDDNAPSNNEKLNTNDRSLRKRS